MILGGYPCVCAKRCLGFCRWQEWQDVSILVTKIERKSRERHRVKRLLLPLTPHSARNITITRLPIALEGQNNLDKVAAAYTSASWLLHRPEGRSINILTKI